MPRLLTTSAGAIRKIQRLTSLSSGLDIARQQTQEVRAIAIIDAKKKWHLPPAFSVEFVAYYEDRHRRIEELKLKVDEQRILHSQMKSEQAEVRSRFETATSVHDSSAVTNKALRQKIQVFRNILSLAGTLPDSERVSALKPVHSDSIIPGTPNVKARATVYSMNQQLKFLGSSSSSKVSLNTCGVCKKSHDQHLLAHCDKCKLYYHLGCLTPPLTRMPKKSKLYGWSCSECFPESSSGEEELFVEEATERKRKRRMAASRARMLAIADAAGHYSGSDDFEYDWHLGFPPSKTLKRHPKKKKIAASVVAMSKPIGDQQVEILSTVPVLPINNLDDEKAAAKAERKLLKKAEKERRKKEKKERKKNKLSHSEDVAPAGDETTLKTSPIRLKIKTIVPPLGSSSAMISYSDTLNETPVNVNGHTSSNEVSDDQMSTSSSANKTRRSSISSGGKRSSTSTRDVRTHCDKCDGPGCNGDLVRCDECKRCYHFSCLIPPVRKSPKVAGYSWHCVDCDPSDRDSDWHLD